MPLVTIQATRFSADQKRRIGDRIIEAFHQEGIQPSSVIVIYKREDIDILLDGGLLIESASEPSPVFHAPFEAPAPRPVPEFVDESKSRSRRTKPELMELKARLVRELQVQGALSSFQAQEELGLKDCDWAPATLRRFFSELEEEGAIVKQGQKRGTRYVWKGITSQAQPGMMPKLVKKSEDIAEDSAEDGQP